MRLFIGGMRGSLPATGGGFDEFGGETTSLLLVGSHGERLVLDAGTGMRAVAGQLAAAGPGEVTILFSHYHLDHMAGLMMNPLFHSSDWSFTLVGPTFADGGVRQAVTRLLAPPYWPISFKQMNARFEFADFATDGIRVGSLRVRGCPMPHPGGALAYRIDETEGNASLVFATDIEWRSRTDAHETAFMKLCCEPRPADMLIIDAHFARAGAEAFAGWGHTCWEDGLEMAQSAGVKRVLLGHHAPEADDETLQGRERQAKKRMPGSAFCAGRTMAYDLTRERAIVLKGLEPVLPYIQNIALAAAVLLAAYLLTIPLRRRYGPSYGVEPKRRSGRQFVGALLNYLAFSILVLVPSIPLIWWFNRVEEPGDWPLYYQAWLSFWIIHLIIRLAEGLFVEIFVQMGRKCPFTRLSRGLLRLAIMLGVVFILIRYQIGSNISVLLTSTAIVTGVIGFAMQGVLGNLLAGMSLHASRSTSVGDWIEVDGEIGKVVLVNWRETRLRTLGGHIVIVPNGKLADFTIRNFSSPTRLRRHKVPVAASYGDAPGEVIAALIEAAQCVPAVETRPAPDAYVTGFKDFCIEYVLRFWSKQYEQRTMIEGHVMRMIWYKFNRRGIEIPFPMSGRMLGNFMEAVHAQQFEKPLASQIERIVDDLLRSDFGRKLVADPEGICMLSRDELKVVARNIKRTHFTSGETLMSQNDDGESFYVLVQGKVHGSIENADAASNVEFELQSGALFGEMSLLTGLPRSATMTAITDCELLEFDRTAFTHLLSLREEIPQVLSDLAAARAKENAESLEKLRASATAPVDLASGSILNRLRRMVGEWRARRTK